MHENLLVELPTGYPAADNHLGIPIFIGDLRTTYNYRGVSASERMRAYLEQHILVAPCMLVAPVHVAHRRKWVLHTQTPREPAVRSMNPLCNSRMYLRCVACRLDNDEGVGTGCDTAHVDVSGGGCNNARRYFGCTLLCLTTFRHCVYAHGMPCGTAYVGA